MTTMPWMRTDVADLRDDMFWDGPSVAVPNPAANQAAKQAAKQPADPSGIAASASPSARSERGARTRREVRPRQIQRVETRGRARALQALYAADLRDYSLLRKISVQVWDDLAIAPEERQFASRLISVILERGAEVDSTLSEVTANWRLERLGAIERSVLRLAAAEFLRGETPPRVVLQEAIHLAERYGTARSARFVNGVLDAYARHVGAL